MHSRGEFSVLETAVVHGSGTAQFLLHPPRESWTVGKGSCVPSPLSGGSNLRPRSRALLVSITSTPWLHRGSGVTATLTRCDSEEIKAVACGRGCHARRREEGWGEAKDRAASDAARKHDEFERARRPPPPSLPPARSRTTREALSPPPFDNPRGRFAPDRALHLTDLRTP